MNAKMPELKRCFEAAGFSKVKTILSSGNVAFDARSQSEAALARKAEAAMQLTLGRSFHTIVRASADLHALLADDPFAEHQVPAAAKRVVSFMREPRQPKLALPVTRDGATLLSCNGREAFCAYVPSDKGPVFMKLIEEAFGSEVTTRTWDTVRKCAAA